MEELHYLIQEIQVSTQNLIAREEDLSAVAQDCDDLRLQSYFDYLVRTKETLGNIIMMSNTNLFAPLVFECK